MTRESFIDHRRATNARQGEAATLKNGEVLKTQKAINEAFKRFGIPSTWRRRAK